MRAVLIGQVDLDGVGVWPVGVDVRLVAAGCESFGYPVAPVDDPRGDGVVSRIGDRAQVERVGGALVDVVVSAQDDGGGHVENRHVFGTGVGVRTVFIGQVGPDGVGVWSVGVGVRLETAAGEGLGYTVAPVDDPRGDDVVARVGNRAQVERVGRAFVDGVVSAQDDRGGHVVDGQVLGAGVGVGAVLVGKVDSDGVEVWPVDVDVRSVAAGCESFGYTVAPVDDPRGDGVVARIGDRAQVERVGGALVEVVVSAQDDRGGHVENGYGFGAGVGVRAVFIGQVDLDGVGVRPVDVDVRLVAAAGERVGYAVAPMDNPLGDGVVARIGDRAQGECVRCAFVDGVVSTQDDYGGHVENRDQGDIDVGRSVVVDNAQADVEEAVIGPTEDGRGSCRGQIDVESDSIVVEVPLVANDGPVGIGRAAGVEREGAPLEDGVGSAGVGNRWIGDGDQVVFDFAVQRQTEERQVAAVRGQAVAVDAEAGKLTARQRRSRNGVDQ